MLQLTPRDIARPHRPKYLQLADAIRKAIADDFLQPGDSMPSEEQLAAMVGSSKAVVRQGLEALKSEGLLVGKNGVKAKVAPASQVRVLSDARYFIENGHIVAGIEPASSAFTKDHGITWDRYKVDVVIQREVATPKDRAMLKLEEGAYVWRRYFVKSIADGDKAEPVEIQRSAIPLFVGDANPAMIDPAMQPPHGGTQRELAAAGYRPTRVTTTAKTRMPTEDEKRDLAIAQVPVLDIERVFWHRDTPVEASRLVLPGNRHEIFYTTVLPD